jgi:hypothetical protein
MFNSFYSPTAMGMWEDWDLDIKKIVTGWPPLSDESWGGQNCDLMDRTRLIQMWDQIPASVFVNKYSKPTSFKGFIDKNVDAHERMNNMHPSEQSHAAWAKFW